MFTFGPQSRTVGGSALALLQFDAFPLVDETSANIVNINSFGPVMRVSDGAMYSANFTPPTGPLA